MEIEIKKGDSLSYQETLAIFKIRSEVFNIEQNVKEIDIDDYDNDATHIVLKVNHKIAAYARIIKKDKGTFIGRVLVTKPFRHQNYGRKLMEIAIQQAKKESTNGSILIHAQYYLKKWYEEMGFVVISEPFIEAEIKHILMQYQPQT